MANIAYWQMQEHDPSRDSSHFNFPSTTDYVPLKGPNHEILFLMGSGAPSTDHNNAPQGSLYMDKTNNVLYLKDGTGANWASVDVTT